MQDAYERNSVSIHLMRVAIILFNWEMKRVRWPYFIYCQDEKIFMSAFALLDLDLFRLMPLENKHLFPLSESSSPNIWCMYVFWFFFTFDLTRIYLLSSGLREARVMLTDVVFVGVSLWGCTSIEMLFLYALRSNNVLYFWLSLTGIEA